MKRTKKRRDIGRMGGRRYFKKSRTIQAYSSICGQPARHRIKRPKKTTEKSRNKEGNYAEVK